MRLSESTGLPDSPRYLFDVNVIVALSARDHLHHGLVKNWFYARSRRWCLCAFTEAGFLRISTAPHPGKISMDAATMILSQLAEHPGYSYVPIMDDWHTLSRPIFKRLFGTKQVTDAYLLGLAIREGLVLVTMDKAILHLAGAEFREHVFLLEA